MKRPKPDKRPDWRDPAMTVERDYIMTSGRRLINPDPEWERRYREHLMQVNPAPEWRNDPTYNLRRKR